MCDIMWSVAVYQRAFAVLRSPHKAFLAMESEQPANNKHRGVARRNVFSRAYGRPTIGHNQGIMLELVKNTGFCDHLSIDYRVKVVAGGVR